MLKKRKSLVLDIDIETIFKIDNAIRFVGVCTAQGNLLEAQYRNDVRPLLNHTSLQFSVIKTAIRHTTRIDNNDLVGNPIYSVTAYENVKRATIPIDNGLLLLVSFELSTNECDVIPRILDVVFGR